MKLMWRVTCSVGKLRGLLKIQGKGRGWVGGDRTPAGFLTCSMKSAEGKSSAGVLVNVAHCTVWSGTPAKIPLWCDAAFGRTRKPESKAGRLSATWIQQISPVDVLRGGGKATRFDAAFILRDPAHPAASTFCSGPHRDEMRLPGDHNSSVSAVGGGDEARSNPPPESPTQSLSGLSPLC